MISIIKKLCFFFQVYKSHLFLFLFVFRTERFAGLSQQTDVSRRGSVDQDEALSSTIQNYRERIFHRNQIYNDLNSFTGIS